MARVPSPALDPNLIPAGHDNVAIFACLPERSYWPPPECCRVVGNPADDISAFLRREQSLGGVADMLKHLWFAGAERLATPLHFHAAVGREITIADRMDLHLLWANKGRLFVKPVPRFLLDPAFRRSNLQCPELGGAEAAVDSVDRII
ncbi:hypothetical protein MFIFM68171_08016 [Madurella fahalii]|uniref:Uncharacterized protein n=1 Tax=Madurella fahalii TaxID=1157608 RepID=A0ABQ0GJ69_9PEZI